MLRLGSVLQLGGAFVVVACLTTAQAQVRTVSTASSTDNDGDYVAPPSPDAEHVAPRSSTDNVVKSGGYGFGGYEQGPTCGGNAYAAPSCGCQANCGCEVGCGCADACCCEGNGCDCCCLPGCSCGWFAAGEVAWLRPSWKGFPAAQLVDPPAVAPEVRTVFDTKYDYDPNGRILAGYTGCNGLGVRGSYWWFDHNSDFLSVTAPANVTVLQGQLISVPGVLPGDRLTSEQSLELQVADAEFTNCFQACGGDMVVSYGLRYAKMRLSLQERIIFVGNTTGVPNLSADYTDEFNGFGPTVGLEFMRPLCFAGLSFYSSLRGSVVVGDSNYRETQRNATGVVTLVRVEDAHESVAIGDIRIALQYCKCGCFARGGWQSQYWNQVAQLPNFGNANISKGQSSLSLDGFFFEVGMQR